MKNLKVQLIAFAALAAMMTPAALAANVPANSDDTMRMAQQIRKKIVMLPQYGVYDNISFAIDGKKVIVRGEATKPTLKKSIERVVSKVEGVEQVVNEIEVLPNSRFDEDIRAAAYIRIYGHPTLNRYNPNRGIPFYPSMAQRTFGPSVDPPTGAHPIHIIVKNGEVTLVGIVDNEGDKTIAGMQANTVSGVFKVVNNLEVAKG